MSRPNQGEISCFVLFRPAAAAGGRFLRRKSDGKVAGGRVRPLAAAASPKKLKLLKCEKNRGEIAGKISYNRRKILEI